MKLIAYLRVSTIGQVTDGLGLPTQERMIRSWAKAHGHRLVRIVSDNGRSGTLAETDRPGLLDAIGAVRRREVAGIVVTSVDRIARTLTVQEAVLAKVWEAGGAVLAVDSGEILRDDPDDPMRTFVRQVMGAVSELDRKLVIKRLRNGRRTAIEQGRRGSGRSPYGYQSEGGVLRPVEHEQAVLDRIRAWHADGVSMAVIADRLNAESVPAKNGRWHPTTVARVLART